MEQVRRGEVPQIQKQSKLGEERMWIEGKVGLLFYTVKKITYEFHLKELPAFLPQVLTLY